MPFVAQLINVVIAADDMDELVHAVKQAIQQCGLQVSGKGVHGIWDSLSP